MNLAENIDRCFNSNTTVKNVKQLSELEYAQCLSLTLGEDGTMQSELAYQYDLDQTGSKAILIKGADSRVIAWSLLAKCGAQYLAHFFVDEDHRRQGLASSLMRQALLEGSIMCCALDVPSMKFFKNFDGMIACEFEDINNCYSEDAA